ncbi:hypothetical protein [Noviherbaspirillum sp. UKPF54]|uniref:hypothetical protein n=1 Tax=Noviherbaspirillum sp. UKPF54 TaxID=2601898 RepID=UPI00143D49E5|nr:hypothetical protein [Noviherbaspirillum sp. UKPF54]
MPDVAPQGCFDFKKNAGSRAYPLHKGVGNLIAARSPQGFAGFFISGIIFEKRKTRAS